MLMYRNQRSLRRMWWRLFLTTLSSVPRVLRRWYAQCLTSLSLQNSATLRNFFSRSAAVLEQVRVHPQDKRSKLNGSHISLVAFQVVPLFFCFPFRVYYCPQREYIDMGWCRRCIESPAHTMNGILSCESLLTARKPAQRPQSRILIGPFLEAVSHDSLSSVARVVRRWCAQCLIPPSLQKLLHCAISLAGQPQFWSKPKSTPKIRDQN